MQLRTFNYLLWFNHVDFISLYLTLVAWNDRFYNLFYYIGTCIPLSVITCDKNDSDLNDSVYGYQNFILTNTVKLKRNNEWIQSFTGQYVSTLDSSRPEECVLLPSVLLLSFLYGILSFVILSLMWEFVLFLLHLEYPWKPSLFTFSSLIYKSKLIFFPKKIYRVYFRIGINHLITLNKF